MIGPHMNRLIWNWVKCMTEKFRVSGHVKEGVMKGAIINKLLFESEWFGQGSEVLL